MSFEEGQQTEGGYSAEAEEAAKQLQKQLASEEDLYYDAIEWDDKHEWHDAYEYDLEEWQASNRELADLQNQQDDFVRDQDYLAAAEVKEKLEAKVAAIAAAQVANGATSSAYQEE